MKVNKSKILDINFDGDHLHFDVRVSVPQHTMTGEYIKNIIALKESFINGYFSITGRNEFIKTYASFEADSDGDIVVKITKDAIKLQ